MSNQELIKKTYYDPETGFVGVKKLLEILKPKGVKKAEIEEFLKKQEIYQTSKKKSTRQNSFIPRYPKQEFQIDLIYLENTHLNKNSYGLCCIDAFTKKGDIELMKSRTAEQTVIAMKEILKRMGNPHIVYCDEGSEYNNGEFKKLMKDNNIELVFTLGHAPFVERFNRSIKEIIAKYLQSTGTKTITTVLNKVLNNYNNSTHTATGIAPNKINEDNQHIAQVNIINHSKPVVIKKAFKVGDKVRIQLKSTSTTKGYKPKFSSAVHTIIRKERYQYFVSGSDKGYFKSNLILVGEVEKNVEKPNLEGTLEGHLKTISRKRKSVDLPELNITERPIRQRKQVEKLNYASEKRKPKDIYEIDKVIDMRTRNGQKEYLVKWTGYDDSYNSWVSEINP